MLLDYENINESNITVTEFRLYNNNDEEIYKLTYNNNRYISYSNLIFLKDNIFYNFKQDTKSLKIIIEFKLKDVKVVKIWYKPINTDRMIIKHYGN